MNIIERLKGPLRMAAVAAALVATAADANPFAPGWTLQPDQSDLRFTSVKNGSVVETSSFAAFSGTIDAGGSAEIRVALDSVDTKIDLRNVRMRFLLLETFSYPEATISLTIPEAVIADLGTVRRKTVTLPYTVSLHGVDVDLTSDISVTLLSDDIVAISNSEPITLAMEDFNLLEGIGKLEETAGVEIVPSASVTFDFVFNRAGNAVELESALVLSDNPTDAALETSGAFSQEECVGRFEILSRTGNIYFNSGSASLRPESSAVLNSIADIISRCPDLVVEVSGHTDSDGSPFSNQQLSEARAASVVTYLTGAGVRPSALVPVGYGEGRPVVPNTSPQNKQRNRRIEFAQAR